MTEHISEKNGVYTVSVSRGETFSNNPVFIATASSRNRKEAIAAARHKLNKKMAGVYAPLPLPYDG